MIPSQHPRNPAPLLQKRPGIVKPIKHLSTTLNTPRRLVKTRSLPIGNKTNPFEFIGGDIETYDNEMKCLEKYREIQYEFDQFINRFPIKANKIQLIKDGYDEIITRLRMEINQQRENNFDKANTHVPKQENQTEVSKQSTDDEIEEIERRSALTRRLCEDLKIEIEQIKVDVNKQYLVTRDQKYETEQVSVSKAEFIQKIKNLEKEIVEKTEINKELDNMIQDKELKLNQAKSGLERKMQEIYFHNKKLEEIHDNMENMKNQIAEYNDKKSNLAEKFETLTSTINDYQRDINELNSEISKEEKINIMISNAITNLENNYET